jgi:hypothetical protein
MATVGLMLPWRQGAMMAQSMVPMVTAEGQQVKLKVRETLYHEKVLKAQANEGGEGEGALASVWQEQQLSSALDKLLVRAPHCREMAVGCRWQCSYGAVWCRS